MGREGGDFGGESCRVPNLKAISLSTGWGQWGLKPSGRNRLGWRGWGCLQGRRRSAKCVQNAQRNENEFRLRKQVTRTYTTTRGGPEPKLIVGLAALRFPARRSQKPESRQKSAKRKMYEVKSQSACLTNNIIRRLALLPLL